jgi:hypothetical protein
MLKRTKLWHSMSVCTIASATLLSGCQSADETAPTESPSTPPSAAQSAPAAAPATASAEGEAEAEGEGRQFDSMAERLQTDDSAYLGQLDLINGHLLVGMNLYQQGAIDAANTHMKHPGDELYSSLQAAFDSRALPGFAVQLQALGDAVNHADAQQVDQAYAELQTAINAHEQAADKPTSASVLLQRVTHLLRAAANEYALGVVGGKVVNVHEYQDAWGFTNEAKALLQAYAGTDADAQDAIAKVSDLLAGLQSLWLGLTPPEQISGDASKLYGTAARVEFIASGLAPTK